MQNERSINLKAQKYPNEIQRGKKPRIISTIITCFVTGVPQKMGETRAKKYLKK